MKSEIPLKSNWFHSKQLQQVFGWWKKFKNVASTLHNNSTERNNRKQFCKSLKTIFDLAAKNAEQQISGDRPTTEKSKNESVAFLHDQRNARKIQMSTLDYESREN